MIAIATGFLKIAAVLIAMPMIIYVVGQGIFFSIMTGAVTTLSSMVTFAFTAPPLSPLIGAGGATAGAPAAGAAAAI